MKANSRQRLASIFGAVLLGMGASLLSLGRVRAAEATPVANPRFTGTPFLSVWRAEDYGASPINWRVLQHPRTGFIYVANNSGVLEFDGATWRLIPMPRRSATRSLVVDVAGMLWVGGAGEICTLEADPVTGTLRAVDQTARLPAMTGGDADPAAIGASDDSDVASNDPHRIGIAWRAVATPDGVYYTPPGRLARFGTDGTVRTWPVVGIAALFKIGDQLYTNASNAGLRQIQDNEHRPIQAGRITDVLAARPSTRVAEGSVVPSPGWTLLTVRGAVQWEGPGALFPAPDPKTAKLFDGESVRCAAFLPGGRVAYGTTRSGLLIVDADGRLLQRIDRSHGLPSDRINDLQVDREGGLWLAMHFALARVEIGGLLAIHGGAIGLEGGPRALRRVGERLYVNHGDGLAWRDDATGKFHAVAGFRTGTHHSLPVGDQVVVSSQGIYAVPQAGPARELSPTVHYGLLTPSRPEGALLVSMPNQVVLWPTLEDSERRIRIAALPAGANQFLESPDGSIWAVLRNDEIWRIDARGGLRGDSPARRYVPGDGLAPARRADGVTLLLVGSELVASSARWLLRYDAAADKFVTDTRLIVPGAEGPNNACGTKAGSAWFYYAGREASLVRVAPAANREWAVEKYPAHAFGDLAINALYHDEPTRTLWIAGQGTLLSFTPDANAQTSGPPLLAVVRHMEDAHGRVLHTPAGRPAPDPLVTLESHQTSLRFAFGSPNFLPDYRGRFATMYRTRLDGLERDWSEWSKEARRDFTNLPPGPLTFRVQARDVGGRVSEEARLAFVLTAPWWRTPWAYLGYGMSAVALMSGVVKLRTGALRRRNEQLEGLVDTRTAELRAHATELGRLRQIDRDESAAAKLAEEKTRLEMLRYQLNPHFLYNALNSIRALVFSKPPAAGEMVSQLADLCRVTLTRNEEVAPVSDEFAMLKLYLDMEKTRWRDKLAVEIDLAPEAAERPIPPFLLLPLVENALKHGRQSTAGVLKLRLSARVGASLVDARDNAQTRASASDAPTSSLILEVANTGEWFEAGQSLAPSTGIGLENLRQRLKRYYPNAHTITTTANEGWVVVSLRLTETRT